MMLSSQVRPRGARRLLDAQLGRHARLQPRARSDDHAPHRVLRPLLPHPLDHRQRLSRSSRSRSSRTYTAAGMPRRSAISRARYGRSCFLLQMTVCCESIICCATIEERLMGVCLVGLNFGVLLGWTGVLCVALPVFQWAVRRRQDLTTQCVI
ncbi:hypothetical protein DFH09DRAFT_224310 [Mycena vulgaris]|nr:hypothetical protein DFH09DRAFT_224310 [Mycena vulgaris]